MKNHFKISDTEKLYDLLSDGLWHSTPEILEKVYGSEHLGIARISARKYDIEKKYNVNVKCKKQHGSIWEYCLQKKEVARTTHLCAPIQTAELFSFKRDQHGTMI